jgi:hypothetical protein
MGGQAGRKAFALSCDLAAKPIEPWGELFVAGTDGNLLKRDRAGEIAQVVLGAAGVEVI